MLVVLTGPSGAGKDSVLAELRRHASEPFGFPVNATTRPPRDGEREGVDYFFLDKNEFARRLKAGDFLEHASVYGQDKGVLKAQVRAILETGSDAILRTDVQGARFIKRLVPQAVTIFITPPSEAEMERRMLSRGGDSPEQVQIRLKTAKEEMAAAREFDYTVINDDLAACVDELVSIIRRERTRAGRPPTIIS